MKRIFPLALMMLAGMCGVTQASGIAQGLTAGEGEPAAVAANMAAQFLGVEPTVVDVAITKHGDLHATGRTAVPGGRVCTFEMVHATTAGSPDPKWMSASAECEG